MEKTIFEVMQLSKNTEELAAVMDCSRKTQMYGLSLTEEEAKELIVSRNDTLKKFKRVELGRGMLDKLIYMFCLERFAASVRSGYDGFSKTQGLGEYEALSGEKRWDSEVYRQVLREQFWE